MKKDKKKNKSNKKTILIILLCFVVNISISSFLYLKSCRQEKIIKDLIDFDVIQIEINKSQQDDNTQEQNYHLKSNRLRV